MIAGSLISTVSSVEKRSPQASQPRRRRMVAPSSDTRESITRVSTCWQNGQCTRGSAVDRELPALLLHVVAHPGDHVVVVRVVEHVADPFGQRNAVGFPVAAGGDRRRADAQAGGDEGLA